ncbi:MAG: glycosyltransferase family 4 protein [Ruegeria sp.]
MIPVSRKLQVVKSPFTPPQAVADKSVAHKKICNALNLPEDSILLGYFGALTNRKRPLHFVDAISAVQKRIPDRQIHGLLFGEAVMQSRNLKAACLDRAADLGIAENIHLMGFREPISGYMAGVDATLVTALSEPFGRTLIEAMYLGTPVIATRHGGNTEAIIDNETGFLIDHESPEAFAEPVLRLLQNPVLYERISATAQKNAENNYGRSQHVKAISEIYDTLVPPIH